MPDWNRNFVTATRNAALNLTKIVLNDTVEVDGQKRSFARNALTLDAMEKIIAALQTAKAYENETVVIANEGHTPFCAGLDSFDLLRFLARTGSCEPMLRNLARMFMLLATHPGPTAAWVAGGAAGGGVGLALCCDTVLAKKTFTRVKEDGSRETVPVTFRIPSGGYRELAAVLIPIIEHRWKQKKKDVFNLESWIGREDDVTGDWSLFVDNWIADQDTIESKIPAMARPGSGPDSVARLPESGLTAVNAAIERATEPEATRAIAGGVIYEAVRLTEESLAKRRHKP